MLLNKLDLVSNRHVDLLHLVLLLDAYTYYVKRSPTMLDRELQGAS